MQNEKDLNPEEVINRLKEKTMYEIRLHFEKLAVRCDKYDDP